MKDKIKSELEEGYEKSKTHKYQSEDWMTKEWEDVRLSRKFGLVKDTGIQVDILKNFGEKITTLPEDWDFHPQVKKIYELRKKSI